MLVSLRVFAVFLVLALLAAPAGAFFPEDEDIFARLGDQYGRMDSYKAKLRFAGPDELSLSIWQLGELWRQEWVSRDGQSPVVASAGLGRGDTLLASYPEGMNGYPRPLLDYWLFPAPAEDLARLGVDPSHKAYGFFENRPCLILGAEGDSRLWLDNERYVPVRLELVLSVGKVEFGWYDYASRAGFWTPAKGRVVLPDSLSAAKGGGSGETADRDADFEPSAGLDYDLAWGDFNAGPGSGFFTREAFAERFGKAAPPKTLPAVLESLQAALPATP